jgi:tRNA G18 (ribose-2'-O)-methylase SpoU|tara:strand:+ start:2450 stop:2995 length:546 start_codon:yes stop_codon:yes gene_type:complete
MKIKGCKSTKKREVSRRQRYNKKREHAKTYPISLCAINFMCDGNLGYLLRSAACFGAECVHVIGNLPNRKDINPQSGSLYDYVKIKKYNTPKDFLDYTKNNNIQIISAEIDESAESLTSYSFNFGCRLALVVGNEQSGVPVEILKASEKVYIPMPGIGFCLNTAQSANILLYEAVRQYEHR